MTKATTKPRRKIFFNKRTNTTFYQIKWKGKFIDEYMDETTLQVKGELIRKNIGQIYIDLSLFPAHTFKNFGEQKTPPQDRVVMWHKHKNGKMYLVYITNRMTISASFRKVNPDGTLAKKVETSFEIGDFYMPNENYKIDVKIRLL